MKKENFESKPTKQPSKASHIFAIFYFIVTTLSLLVYTATSSIKIVKNGWNISTITLAIFVGLNYVVLFACMIFASNSKSAKAGHTKAKKGLKIAKKLMKIVNAISTVVVIVGIKSVDIWDMMSKITAFVSLFFHIVGLGIAIFTMIAKIIVKRKVKKYKENISQIVSQKFVSNTQSDVSSQSLATVSDDNQGDSDISIEQTGDSVVISEQNNSLSEKIANTAYIAKNMAKDWLNKKK